MLCFMLVARSIVSGRKPGWIGSLLCSDDLRPPMTTDDGSAKHRQEVATAHKVAGMFGRRDPMRRYMDKIMAMIDEIGECARDEE